MQMSFMICAFEPLDYIPMSGITGSYRRSIPNYFRNGYIAFQKYCSIWHTHQQWMRVLSPTSSSTLMFFLIGVSFFSALWFLIIVFTWGSLMINHRHFFISFFGHSYFFWKEFFVCLLSTCFDRFRWLNFARVLPLYILCLNHLLDEWLINTFSQSMCCLISAHSFFWGTFWICIINFKLWIRINEFYF